MFVRIAAIVFLLAQAIGTAVWWSVLIAWPSTRAFFLARYAPESTLLAFGPGDALLFIVAPVLCAYGLFARRRWGWPLLCVCAGAAIYAGLYTWSLVVISGRETLLGALLMTPSLIIPAACAWALRPRSGA